MFLQISNILNLYISLGMLKQCCTHYLFMFRHKKNLVRFGKKIIVWHKKKKCLLPQTWQENVPVSHYK